MWVVLVGSIQSQERSLTSSKTQNKGLVLTFHEDPKLPPPSWSSPPLSDTVCSSLRTPLLPASTRLSQYHGCLPAASPPGVPLNSLTSTSLLTPAALTGICTHLFFGAVGRGASLGHSRGNTLLWGRDDMSGPSSRSEMPR